MTFKGRRKIRNVREIPFPLPPPRENPYPEVICILSTFLCCHSQCPYIHCVITISTMFNASCPTVHILAVSVAMTAIIISPFCAKVDSCTLSLLFLGLQASPVGLVDGTHET